MCAAVAALSFHSRLPVLLCYNCGRLDLALIYPYFTIYKVNVTLQ